MTRTAFIALSACIAAGAAQAGEATLTFRFFTTPVEQTVLPAPTLEGVTVHATRYAGFAIFEDGAIATKAFSGTMRSEGATGAYEGYSTYTMENGDSLTLSYVGGWGADRDGGDYVVLAGTGAFTGATGTGRFDSVESPFEGYSAWTGEITVTTPDT